MLLLLVAGLITTDVVTSSSLRSFLLGRLDEQIDASQDQAYNYITQVYQRDLKAGDRTPVTDPGAWLAELGTEADGHRALHRRPGPPIPGSTARCWRPGSAPTPTSRCSRPTATIVIRVPSGLAGNPDPAPVPARGAARPAHPDPGTSSAPSTGPTRRRASRSTCPPSGRTGCSTGSRLWRCPGGTLVTAISLDPTDKTLASLTHVEVIVSIVVIIALLLLALWIVRLGMRPLDDMTETAGAIAGGDLTRRIRRADDRSEVGRLGSALNGMLSQIEAAFRERTSSEARLRRFVADASHELRTPADLDPGLRRAPAQGGVRRPRRSAAGPPSASRARRRA